MSWRTEKTRTGQDIVWDTVELGISPSPTKGIANLQNVNISTESGEMLASYARTAQQQTAITNGTLTPNGATNFTGPATLKAGTWISVSASTVTSISTTTSPSSVTADYLVVGGGGAGGSTDSSYSYAGGGGGAGGEVKTGTNAFSVGTTVITVGTGGSVVASTLGQGGSGGSSSLGSVSTASGGSGGGSSTTRSGVSGVNGGGAGAADVGSAGTGGTGTNKSGGNGIVGGGATGAGGGGGAGNSANGSNAPTAATGGTGGAGGAGTSSSISGSSVGYGGGGGGGGGNLGGSSSSGGGLGGGDSAGTAGTANTGGGGGGAGSTADSRLGGAGGSGIVVISYTTGAMVAFGGAITFAGGKTIHTFTSSGAFTVVSIAKTNLYYVSYASGTTFKLSSAFDPTGANALSHGTTGSITFSTVAVPNQGVAKATEQYTTASATAYRYYVLDANGYTWVWDTTINAAYGTQWMLPDTNDYSTLKLTGLAALNGQLVAVGMTSIYAKPTVDLGRFYNRLDNCWLNEPFPTHKNFAITSASNQIYYCDGNYIGELFPTTSLITSIVNIQSNCSYTASSTTGTISAIVSGSIPYSGDSTTTRIPAVFFTDVYGTQPTNLIPGTVYYIQYAPASGTFEVYTSAAAGSAINIATGATGNQYFNTFWPFGSQAGINGTVPTLQFTSQRVNLPNDETANSLVELGSQVLIGGNTGRVYLWNQIDAGSLNYVSLPEDGIKTMINVNNTAYIFAGNKGNIYISNGSVASLILKVPDYCAGVPGTPLTYIEPVYTWGDADYVRGRVYFSILDQTATKAGNCGGVWSFVPTQNIDPNQDIGMALRLENQNSYGDYDGYCNLIIANQEQNVTSPQYWTVWQDSYSTGTSSFGIDGTGTTPVTQYIFETDLLPVGTFLEKGTFQQLEYKLTTPLASGDSIQLYYRTNSTEAWTSMGSAITETGTVSAYFSQIMQKNQWLQFRGVVTTGGTTASSFVRFKQLMLR
jgi:hypothetical protein